MTTEASGESVAAAPSIHSLRPLERGGVVARRGFAYQDHVAVAFFLEMLANPELSAVWCEAEDDITLIWALSGGEAVEFVQVKHEQLTQLWTASKLCERDRVADAAAGDDPQPASLLEKSLSHDRCSEPCSFRIVTSWQLHPEITVLQYPIDHAYRASGHEQIEAVVARVITLASRHRGFSSANGHDADFWVRHVVWSVRESEQAVVNANAVALEAFVGSQRGILATDQRRELYIKLLMAARNAAEAPYDPDPTVKKLARVALLEYMQDQIEKAEHPSRALGGAPLRDKMNAAGLPEATIESAWDLRFRYREQALAGKYLSLEDREVVEGAVQARLNELLSAWHANEFGDTPAEFHNRCLHALSDLQASLPVAASIAMLQGVMYDVTARCRHRFTRIANTDLPPTGSAMEGTAA